MRHVHRGHVSGLHTHLVGSRGIRRRANVVHHAGEKGEDAHAGEYGLETRAGDTREHRRSRGRGRGHGLHAGVVDRGVAHAVAEGSNVSKMVKGRVLRRVDGEEQWKAKGFTHFV